MKKYERVKALVSLDAIAHNFEEMHKNVKEGTKIIAVIKADGYGHGARAIARLIQDYDYIWGFASYCRGGTGASACRDHQACPDPWPCV